MWEGSRNQWLCRPRWRGGLDWRAGREQSLDFVTSFLPIPEEMLDVSGDADVIAHHTGIPPQKTEEVVPVFPAGVAFHALPPTHRQWCPDIVPAVLDLDPFGRLPARGTHHQKVSVCAVHKVTRIVKFPRRFDIFAGDFLNWRVGMKFISVSWFSRASSPISRPSSRDRRHNAVRGSACSMENNIVGIEFRSTNS